MACVRKLRPLFHLSPYFKGNYRLLFTERRLKIDKYRSWRTTWANQRIRIVNSMQENVSNEDKRISPRDLRNFLAIVDNEDLDLLEAAVRKFNKHRSIEEDSQETTVMMAYYCLNQPDKALEMLRDEELSDYFRQASCLIVAMQLLYNTARYREIIDIYKSCQNLEKGFPSVGITLVMASCYLLNSREGLEIAVGIIDNIRDRGKTPICTQAALAGALALRQGRYRLAAYMCSPAALPNLNVFEMGCAVRSIQLISLAKLGKISDAVDLLSQYAFTSGRNPATRPPSICRETVDELAEIVRRSGGTEDKEDMMALYNYLNLKGRFDSRQKLIDILLAPIDLKLNPRILEAKDTWRERLMGRRAEDSQ